MEYGICDLWLHALNNINMVWLKYQLFSNLYKALSAGGALIWIMGLEAITVTV